MSRARTDGEAMEMAALRERTAMHIKDVDPETRNQLAVDIEREVLRRYDINEIDGIYVAGSWAEGDAIPGVSDIDIRVVARPDDSHKYLLSASEHFKNDWSPGRSIGPFLYVDLWIAPYPPAEPYCTLLVDNGGSD